MKLTNPQKIFLFLYIGLVIFWFMLFVMHITEGFYNYLYSLLFGLIPLIGGYIAIRNAKRWGGMKSAVGKAIIFTGIGVFLWGIGEAIWSYYNFFVGVAAPYPSLADIGFAPSIFFYGVGIAYLSRATGAKYGLRSKSGKVIVVLSLIAVMIFSYHILINIARGGILVPENESILKTILDIVYPLGDFFALAVAVIISGLSFRYLGGQYIFDVIALLAGLAVMFIADTIFSYTTTTGTYYNANFGDLMLTTGTFLLTFGILGFYKSDQFQAEQV